VVEVEQKPLDENNLLAGFMADFGSKKVNKKASDV